MDDFLEVMFEGALELLGVILESDRVPKFVRYLILGLIILGLTGLIGYGLVSSTVLWITILLGVAQIAVLAGGGFLLFKIFRSAMLRPAKKEELPDVLKLYRSVIGRPGCTWNVFYPNETTLQEDFATGNLYVLDNGKELIGAGSVVPENELEDLPFWGISEKAREIARIVVAPAWQGKDYGKQMVSKLCKQLEETGCKAVHLLAATQNSSACKLYERVGFRRRGECHRYDHDYYAYEKKL